MSKRRKAGEGSIFQRADGLWVGSISVGSRTARTRKVVYGRTPVRVRDELTRLRNKVLSGLELRVRDERATVTQYLDSWLASPDRWKPATARSYADLVRIHIGPCIGHIRLARLAPVDVRDMLADMEAKGASARIRQMAFGVLSTALREALRLEVVVRNPCEAVKKPRAPVPEVNAMTREQVETFLAAARTDRLYALYGLAISTGMRQGELLGLRWQDIDLGGGSVSVRHTLAANRDGKPELARPKTSSSRRKIELAASDVRVLREHQARMFSEGLRTSEFVFCNTKGLPLHKDNLCRRSFARILRRAGLGHFRFHDLRHTAATLALEQGIHPKVVAERLGHASVRMTLDRYSHVTPTMQRDAADRIGALLREALA